MPITINPIKFGTDGWRGSIAADFTMERVARLAPLAAQVLADLNPNSNSLIIGYDRRFMAEDFAHLAAEVVSAAGFDVLLSKTYAPTPAFSWAAFELNAIGALVMTASHNPPGYLGLKVKGSFGGSVSPEVTKKIEARLSQESFPQSVSKSSGSIVSFDPWPSYCQKLRSLVNIEPISSAIASGKLQIFPDVMHGAAATGLSRLLGLPIIEINGERDPLFGGNPPEPLPRYLSKLFRTIRFASRQSKLGIKVGLVFDGDCDRIAAVDGQGNFLSSQILIPILMAHLAQERGFTGEVVKTVSGSDLIPRVAKLFDLSVFETPIGYKYIADRMLSSKVLIGGEESGGIGYGTHIPERDALLSALYLLEAIVTSNQNLNTLYQDLQEKTGFSFCYDRIDLPLASMDVRAQLLDRLKNNPPGEIAGKSVVSCLSVDGYKFGLADSSWLLIRFSGTEPVLRLYCEAPTMLEVRKTLAWAKDWANSS